MVRQRWGEGEPSDKVELLELGVPFGLTPPAELLCPAPGCSRLRRNKAAMTKFAWLLVVLAMGLPASIFGQGKPTENTSETVVITAPPLPPPSKPAAPPERVISKNSEKMAHFVVSDLVPVGSLLPLVISYYKGFAYVRNSPQEIPVTLVPHHGHLYAVLKLPGIPPELKVVKLGVYKE